MARSRTRDFFLLTALCLILQGVLLYLSARGTRVPAAVMTIAVACLALAIMVMAILALGAAGRRVGSGRRAGLFLMLAAELGLLLAWAWPRWGQPDAEDWLLQGRRQLTAAVELQEQTLQQLGRGLCELVTEARSASDSSFALVDHLQAHWRRQFPSSERFPLSIVLWRGRDRIAWDARGVPLTAPAAIADTTTTAGSLARSGDTWYWRQLARLNAVGREPLLLELQLSLGRVSALSAEGAESWRRATGRPQLHIEVLPRARPVAESWFGNAEKGLRLVRELVWQPEVAAAERPGLRLTASLPPWRADREKAAARQQLLLLAFWLVAAAGFGWRASGTAGLVTALWLGRGLLAGVDYFRWVQPAFPGQHLPALPGELSSLIDPAYFATVFAGGWFASTADALLTAILVTLTALVLVRRLFGARSAGGGPGDAAPERSERPRSDTAAGLLYGLLAVFLLLLLRECVIEITENANPRLIGPKISLSFLTFWILHVVLYLIAGSVLGLLAALLVQRQSRRAGVIAVLVAVAAAILVPELVMYVRLLLVLSVLLLWLAAPLVINRTRAGQRLYLLVPLLLTVGWNYAVMAEAYGRAQKAWMLRKVDMLVQPQDDWIQFLLKDVLVEMAALDHGVPAAPVTAEAAPLWQNREAFDLWQESAVHDLSLPCLVEIMGPNGDTVSLFASGFFRDFGYEVRERSEWRAALEAQADATSEVLLQKERRRYPMGEEWILRGEVARRWQDGWIRLELPVQSKRIATLTASLMGTTSEMAVTGYRPRAEIDRPLLLLRGDAAGWLDAGPRGLPSRKSEVQVTELRQGHVPWAQVEVDGEVYRCLWRRLPADSEADSTAQEGFLLGLGIPSTSERLLDISRLLLLYLVLAALMATAWQAWRWLRGGRPGLVLGFQDRFLVGYLVLGLLLLLIAGTSVDRLSQEWIDAGARQQTRDGIAAALGQLQNLLTEQAGALAESEYIADLLANRLAGQRPLGPFDVRQGMVFGGDGELLLDETLSDLDAAEAAELLAAAREGPLVVVADAGDLFFGTVIPIDLSAVMPDTGAGAVDPAGLPLERRRNGFFFYRQRADSDLISGLAEIIQGEMALHWGGEVARASHPERIFSGLNPLMTPPELMQSLRRQPAIPHLYANPGTRLSFTGSLALPALSLRTTGSPLSRAPSPAVLAATFPARERDFADQRAQTVLFLAGLATLIFLAAAAMAALLTWNIFGPVRMLVTATRRLAAGDFAAPLPESGRDEIGTLAGSFRAMRDELRSTQNTLAERERFLTTVLDRVPVGVVVFTQEKQVVALNPACRTILAEFYGHGADADEQALRLLAGFTQVIDRLQQPEGELHSQDQQRTLRGRLAPLDLPDGRRDTMIVFEDVTEFLNNKRLALNAELARQVAHEIKNPLTPIQLSVQLLSQAYHDRAPELDRIVDDTVARILEQVTLLRSIAGEFSLLGRPGELQVEPVDLMATVRNVIAGYQGFGAKGGPTGPHVTLAEGEIPPVLAHRESLIKVLGNLMENSLDAAGGARQLQLEISWRVSPVEVILVWADNGLGLSPDAAAHLFDPYFSTKSTGTGLGLAICRNLLDKMGGGIRLTNRTDGPGAVAEVSLPRLLDGTDQAAPEVAPATN